jgi:4-hydroxy-3-polyprenylbenzoate decarboxylase
VVAYGSLLAVKTAGDGRRTLEAILRHPIAKGLPLVAVVSQDVDIRDAENRLWGIFTRFDCARDVLFSDQRLIGIAPVYSGTMGIDATWKTGYPDPLRMTDVVRSMVESKWESYWR